MDEKEGFVVCGRYNFTNPFGDKKLAAVMRMVESTYPGVCKTGEIFPGDTAPAIILKNSRVSAVPAVFGFPGFEGSKLIINARAETVTEKKSFARALRETRAVLPASGFYEWSHDKDKSKYLFERETRTAMYFCGIYRIIDGKYRFVILTRESNESMAGIHNRMPVIIDETLVRSYLTDFNTAKEIIRGLAPELKHNKA